MSENLPGINSGNTREHKVRSFLAKPPKLALKLCMLAFVDEGSPVQLHEWQREEVLPALAADILSMLDEHAQEMGGSVQCTLTYVDEAGKQLGTMVLKRQASHIAPQDGAELTATVLQGDAKSLVVAAQAQSLQVQRLYLSSMAGVLAASERLANRAEDAVGDLQKRIARLEVENETLRQAVAYAEAMAASGEVATPTTEAQSAALKMLEQMAPLIMQRLLSPTAPASA